jgi:hypothetical protein
LSSILKALKRIEGKSPPPEAFPGLPESVDAKRAVSSTARRRSRLRRLIAVCLVLLIIVIAAVMVFQNRKYLIAKIFPAGPPTNHQQKVPQNGKKSKIFSAKIPPSTVKPASPNSDPKRLPRPTTKTVAPEQKLKEFRTINRYTESSDRDRKQNAASMPAVSSQHPPGAPTDQKPTPQPAAREKFRPSKKSIAGKRAAASKPAVAAGKTEKTPTYAKLADSSLKLQALAWSSDAARRMAVINGRIVREGESMDGYQINQIRQEDVVVSDGRQSWRLEFGLKQ